MMDIIETDSIIEEKTNSSVSSVKYDWIDFNYNLIEDLTQYKDEEHKLIITSNEELSKIEINNWKYNRPPDMNRIPEIVKYYKRSKIIDGVIYIVKIEDLYYCYDGIHRLEALKSMNKEIKLIIDIYNNPLEEIIYGRFRKINRAIPVPDLYITKEESVKESVKENVKEKIENVINYFKKNYNEYFSSSSRCNKPNENRDSMNNKLYELLNENEKKELFNNISSKEIIEYLEYKNKYFKKYVNEYKLTNSQLKKCKEKDFYLFITKDWHIKNNNILLKELGYM
jgi:hypothetical protein